MTRVLVVGNPAWERNQRYIHSDKGRATRQAYYAAYKNTPRFRYTHQRKQAIRRGIAWELTFDEWWAIWLASGKWAERGPLGYQMCRKGDTGPYAKDNVYIAHHTENKRDAWYNGRTKHPPIGARKGKRYPRSVIGEPECHVS